MLPLEISLQKSGPTRGISHSIVCMKYVQFRPIFQLDNGECNGPNDRSEGTMNRHTLHMPTGRRTAGALWEKSDRKLQIGSTTLTKGIEVHCLALKTTKHLRGNLNFLKNTLHIQLQQYYQCHFSISFMDHDDSDIFSGIICQVGL